MTKIEWVKNGDGSEGRTWNPTLGCSKTSPGCQSCYAISVAHRGMTPAHKGLTVMTPDGPDWTGEVRTLPERLDVPRRRKVPTTWFVDSMSDLFEASVPAEFIGGVWDVMASTPQHTYQLLTKRPQRMAKLLAEWEAAGWTWRRHDQMWCGPIAGPLANAWVGTSIESDRYTFRADHLRRAPAALRWLSCEPLLGQLPSLDLTGIDWVIVGGESGPGARPMHPDWARDIRDRCLDASVPYFFKQWGEWAPYEQDPQPPFWISQHGDLIDRHHLPADLSEGDPTDGWWAPDLADAVIYRRVGKKAAGRDLDGRTWDEMPAVAR